MHTGSVATPLGWINIEASDWAVFSVYFTGKDPHAVSDHPLVREAMVQLLAYFNGTREGFNLPLEAPGTVFQRQIWDALQDIRFGQTVSYAELAARLGKDTHVRVIAGAVAANPLAILIPCHRVIGSDGQLTGYAWGTEKKQWLLTHEANKSQLTLF